MVNAGAASLLAAWNRDVSGAPQPSRRFQFVEDGGFWNLDYMFAENTKTLSDGVSEVGWNYFYKESASAGEHWVAIANMDGNPPYQAGDFSQLFTFE